jgi:hypothetical protein
MERRDFIKGGFLATVAAVVAPTLLIAKPKPQAYLMSVPTVPGRTYSLTMQVKVGEGKWEHITEVFKATEGISKLVPVDYGKEITIYNVTLCETSSMRLSGVKDPVPASYVNGVMVDNKGRGLGRINDRSLTQQEMDTIYHTQHGDLVFTA